MFEKNFKKRNAIFIIISVLMILIGITARGAYSYFTYEKTYNKSGSYDENEYLAKESVEYIPIHNVKFIVEGNLNNKSGCNIFYLSNFPGIANTTGVASKVDGKYTYSTTYIEDDQHSLCSFAFKVNDNCFTGDISRINIPKWSDVIYSSYTKTYNYNTENFVSHLEEGYYYYNDPSLIVTEDMDGNVTITIRMAAKCMD